MAARAESFGMTTCRRRFGRCSTPMCGCLPNRLVTCRQNIERATAGCSPKGHGLRRCGARWKRRSKQTMEADRPSSRHGEHQRDERTSTASVPLTHRQPSIWRQAHVGLMNTPAAPAARENSTLRTQHGGHARSARLPGSQLNASAPHRAAHVVVGIMVSLH